MRMPPFLKQKFASKYKIDKLNRNVMTILPLSEFNMQYSIDFRYLKMKKNAWRNRCFDVADYCRMKCSILIQCCRFHNTIPKTKCKKKKRKEILFFFFSLFFLSFSIFFELKGFLFIFGRCLKTKQIVESKQTKTDLDAFLFNKRSTMGQLIFNLLLKNLILNISK